MKEKFLRFMQGRYGVDQFSKFLTGFMFIVMLCSFITPKSRILSLVAVAILIYIYYRMFSKNFQKRYEENQKYLKYSYKVYVWRDKQKKKWQQLKAYHIYKCPTCRQKIRIPRGKGRVAISCPKCHNEFIKKS